MSVDFPATTPVAEIEVEVLFRRLRRLYWWSLGIAIAIHLGLIVGVTITTRTEEGQAAEPAKVKFFTRRDPLLAKPLELRKVPQPKRQLVRREVQVSAARMDQVRATAAFDTRSLIAGQGSGVSAIALPRPLDHNPNMALGLGAGLEAQGVNTSRTVENKIDMALEMLDVNSMDTGRYRAMVVQDAKDRQNLKGFIRFAQVMSASAVSSGTMAWGNIGLGTVDALRDALNEYTGVHADFVGSISFDDERLMEVPIIIPQGTPNESEMAQLAKYLLAGGFVFGAIWGEALEKYGGLVQGRDYWSARLPDDHAVFSSFFDLKGGVPSAGGAPFVNRSENAISVSQYLIGYFVKGRLAGVSFFGLANTRNMQMTINLVVYALTQEGSMTQRLMQMVN
ncbi:MAG: DUF4159 domain-containing protein [Candidatus Latescibacteria bacterium]|nr:DUF4159 domain-containing protein [Candidatus Latescibacterota bacterium]